MQFIQPKVEIIEQEPGIEGIYKQIELAGRTCYKSENKITKDSCKEFVHRMIHSGHGAMLEHGTVYLKIPVDDWREDWHEWVYMFPEGCPWVDINSDHKFIYISTNYRHIIDVYENAIRKYICEPTDAHEKRVSVRFTCDRGVSHELVRHKNFVSHSSNTMKNKFRELLES